MGAALSILLDGKRSSLNVCHWLVEGTSPIHVLSSMNPTHHVLAPPLAAMPNGHVIGSVSNGRDDGVSNPRLDQAGSQQEMTARNQAVMRAC